ncbi:type 4a pilus biogenesis protein PilO [Vibrio diazotrophicus]|jgi:type IV pilus assembly protein PilO|uniref:type 4a pilus biogenesis protein PilO n=1 Tax=Vibrio diazotrophicus TaxID=685 RepID=UPI0022AF66AD|nr:type 4a pilus biogenesis protein PilO [Vibrio diazotrophicus]MCZ4372180.1 type 4a pilus biogenesis protein PilO [Vibrio diazotrophicus]
MGDFKNLELDEILDWPRLPQLVVLLLVVVLIQAAGYWFYLVPKQEHLSALIEEEQTLKSTIRIKAHKAATLPQLKAQLDELSERYDYLLQQLPEQKELASMLAAVNELGIKHQLSFNRMDWGEKEQQAFLYRLPLNLELTGEYHHIGQFSQAIAQLPRIIYFEHVDFQRASQDSQKLSVNVRAFTYQYQPDSLTSGGQQ